MYAIVCMNDLQGIGYRGMIPWKSKEDMRFFRRVTIGDGNNAVVMGHNTFKSIGSRPLSNRKNYVLTRTLPCTETHPYENDSVVYLTNIENVLLLSHLYDKVFIIGGEEIYKTFEPHYQKIYVTHIHNHIPCDTFFTVDINSYIIEKETHVEDNGIQLRFVEYKKRNTNENYDLEAGTAQEKSTDIKENKTPKRTIFQKYRESLVPFRI